MKPIKKIVSLINDSAIKQKGFTLIELLVAISILSVIFAIILSTGSQIQKRARDDQRKADISKLQVALQEFYQDNGFYPRNASSSEDCTGKNACKVGSTDAKCKCTNLDFMSILSNMTGNPNDSIVSKVYLNSLPQEPLEHFYHYCYRALKTDSETEYESESPFPCDNTSVNKRCNSYRIFSRMETVGSGTTYSCTDGQGSYHQNTFSHYNFMIGPNDNF
jgi:prepilin-type N-terminal cleavage/methylation domain-containing protein